MIEKGSNTHTLYQNACYIQKTKDDICTYIKIEAAGQISRQEHVNYVVRGMVNFAVQTRDWFRGRNALISRYGRGTNFAGGTR